MAEGGSFSNPLADEKDAGGKDGGGGGGSGGSSKTPVRQSLAHVFPRCSLGRLRALQSLTALRGVTARSAHGR